MNIKTDGLFTLAVSGIGTRTLTNGLYGFYVEPFTLHLNRDREEWVTYPFSGPKTLSGGVFQYLNGSQVSSAGPDTASVKVSA